MAKSLNISEFRSQCLTLLDHLPEAGVVITKRGRPVARVLPIQEKKTDNQHMFGALKGVLEIQGGIFSTGDSWDAES
jgi:prevent-host-death family protein